MAEPTALEGAATEGPHALEKGSATDSIAQGDHVVNTNDFEIGDYGVCPVREAELP